MKIIDISWPVSSATTGYKDKKVVQFDLMRSFDKDGMRETVIHMESHTGTHIDAPFHLQRDGKTIDELDLNTVIGPCKVLDMTSIGTAIGGQDLIKHDIQKGDIILFRTTNSVIDATDKFCPNFIYIDDGAADYLVKKGIKAVGLDYIGLEHSQQDHPTHIQFFDAGITIIEGLRLVAVKPGNYFLCCLPLNLIGIEAAPARAVLIEER